MAPHNDTAVKMLSLSNPIAVLKLMIVRCQAEQKIPLVQSPGAEENGEHWLSLCLPQSLLLLQGQAPLGVKLPSNLTETPQICSLVIEDTFDLFPPCKSLPTTMVPA